MLVWLTLGGAMVGSIVFWLGIKKLSRNMALTGIAIVIAPVVAHALRLI